MINGLFNPNADHDNDSVATLSEEVASGVSEEENPEAKRFGGKSVKAVPITDAEAEQMLPGYAVAFEEYHLHRSEGDAPEEALQKTLTEWRNLWAKSAYVPHRRQF